MVHSNGCSSQSLPGTQEPGTPGWFYAGLLEAQLFGPFYNPFLSALAENETPDVLYLGVKVTF